MVAGYPAQGRVERREPGLGDGLPGSLRLRSCDGWMHSPGHRENILRLAFAEVGIGDRLRHRRSEPRGRRTRSATYATSFGGAPLPASR